VARLTSAGVEVLVLGAPDRAARLADLFDELGRRRLTNVLVEGGAGLLGACFDGGHLDEIHVFIAPKLVGGAGAPSPVGGRGLSGMTAALRLEDISRRPIGDDLYLTGRIVR
jgi:diaminohydroxyphosphoribosylaminopyrimidine deaminase/5-amino-6-(5-phosphoribosylamino)uracil reductase